MDDSDLGIEEQFWLSDAESMARMITDKMGVIESYHQPSEYAFELTPSELRSPLFRLAFLSKWKMKFRLKLFHKPS
ncbi:hypothetical protein [Planktothrix mougeotii]|uniref:Uncharacterized protein n=1 Tax=Planktothrix mougeotii LEGE 06226 TaxID=1828728 RepID=A0ABR9UDR6_9CYAN|nr:hypothetical protein [Planktothrix mougeotii]MBE9144608.1 hypothetical protein [Planktothrix mougeotii LEGE 06226]